ncbi:hypothetical protein CN372_26090 [Bacillus anthracis]|nr:hypothetical protein CN372_26090 [Bacillus anthracis]
MISSVFGEFPYNIFSYIFLYIPCFYLSAYIFVSEEWEIAKKKQAHLSMDSFMRFIPRCYGIMKKLSGRIEGFYYKAFGIPVLMTLIVQFVLWVLSLVLDLAIEYSAVILIIVGFVVWGYVAYRRSLKKKFEQNRINAGILIQSSIEDLADQFEVLGKMRKKNMRQVVPSEYSHSIKEYIYSTRITLPNAEFDEDEIRDAVIEVIDTVCENHNWMYGDEPAFEILEFRHQSYNVHITLACKSNEETINKVLLIQEKEAKKKGYKDARDLKDDDY